MGISKVANSDTGLVNYVYDGTDYQPATRMFLGSVDPTTEGFTGASGDAWVPIPDADFVTQAEFDAQGPSGRELAWASSTVYQSTISTVTDLTGLAISFTVVTRPVMVHMHLPMISGTVADMLAYVNIADGAGTSTRSSTFSLTTSGAYDHIDVYERISTPGTYFRKGTIVRGSATGTLSNGFPSSGAASIVSYIEALER